MGGAGRREGEVITALILANALEFGLVVLGLSLLLLAMKQPPRAAA